MWNFTLWSHRALSVHAWITWKLSPWAAWTGIAKIFMIAKIFIWLVSAVCIYTGWIHSNNGCYKSWKQRSGGNIQNQMPSGRTDRRNASKSWLTIWLYGQMWCHCLPCRLPWKLPWKKLQRNHERLHPHATWHCVYTRREQGRLYCIPTTITKNPRVHDTQS